MSESMTNGACYSLQPHALPLPFRWSHCTEPYLAALRTEYDLERLVADCATDRCRVQVLCAWVRNRWEHDSDNEPRSRDPLTILREAQAGKRFRCTEYASVLAGVLSAIGIPARSLCLRTADCETRERGAAHVVTEAYLRDQSRWLMVDAQWDALIEGGGRVLNAVELQQVLASGMPEVTVAKLPRWRAKEYFAWLRPYLFYFDVAFDNRIGVPTAPERIMLVPLGANEPVVFQRRWPLRSVIYTHSVPAFYPIPHFQPAAGGL